MAYPSSRISHADDSRSFSRIEFLGLAYQHLSVSGGMILWRATWLCPKAWLGGRARLRPVELQICCLLGTRNWQRRMPWNVNIKPELLLPKAFAQRNLRLDRSVRSIQPLSPLDASHPTKLRSCGSRRTEASSRIFEAIKRVLDEAIVLALTASTRPRSGWSRWSATAFSHTNQN
jgi:hypothetical protein